MSNFKSLIGVLVFSGSFTAFAQAPVMAEDISIDIGDIIISANRSETKKDKVGSAVEVVTDKDIQQQSQPYLGDYLTQLPGVSVSDSGGPGQPAGIFMRGAGSQYIKMQINGIDVSDPSSTQTRAQLEKFVAGGANRIEVLKGSQSMLYGGSAVAGVIDISTQATPNSGVHHRLFGEYGSYNTLSGGYAMEAANERSQASLKILGISSDGFSAADENNGNTEDDSHNNITVLPALSLDLSDMVTVFGSGVVIKSHSQFDNGFPVSDNRENDSNYTQLAGRAGATFRLLDGRFENTISGQWMQIDRDFHSVSNFGPYDANYTSHRAKMDYIGAYHVNDMLTMQAGTDYERISATIKDNYSDTSQHTETVGFWGQAIISPLPNLTITGGGRYDHHSTFGSFGTYRATTAYLVKQTGTKLRGSVSRGFRAPSLYELYAPADNFGNANGNDKLKPETSFSWDAGFDQNLPNNIGLLSVSYFELNTKQLIDYTYANPLFFSGGQYRQIPGTTKRRGVEVGLKLTPTDWLGINAAYTYTHAKKKDGTRLFRVPKHDIGIAFNIIPAERWAINLSAKAALDTLDTGSYDLDDYFKLNAKISYQAHDNLELYVRGENLTDKEYQVVKGYGTSDFAIYGGFNARF